MPDDNDLRRDLLWRIDSRRASVQAFLREHRPRTRRRATITVVLSSLAALFTAGPAFGGEPFAQSVQNTLGLASDSYVWRTLCLLALLVSVGAAVLTNLGKAQDGVKLYQQYIVKIPFVDDQPGAALVQPSVPWQGYYAPPPSAPGQYAPPPPPGRYPPPPQP